MSDRRQYTDRIVHDLRVDLTERIKHVETVARDAAKALGKLLAGFPAMYATKQELEHVRTTADNLQIHLIGRDRFEVFEEEVNNQFKQLAAQVGRASGIRATIVTGGVVAVTIVIVLLTLMQQSVSSLDSRTNQLEHQVIVLQDQVTSIQELDKFFCKTRGAAHLPAC